MSIISGVIGSVRTFVTGAILALVSMTAFAQTADPRLDPLKVKGAKACAECHEDSHKVWQGTHHYKTFRTLPRKDKAKEIAGKLGLKRIKKESACLTCHFTSRAKSAGKSRPVSGISCESCHGAGADWIDVHGDYGGKNVKRENEDPAHRLARWKKSEAAGMIRPIRLYEVARNCYGCHTVPNEKLVNVGGHKAGSDFELVSWSQGEVRHNVWYTRNNDEASAKRKRMMYIVGKALDLEFALRGVAKATVAKTYAISMAKRAKAAGDAMKAIAAKIPAPEIHRIIKLADGAKLDLNNERPLTAAADKIGALTKKFAESHDGGEFASVDSLIPGVDEYRGEAQ